MTPKIPTVLFLIDGLRPEALEMAPMPNLLKLRESNPYIVAHSLAPFCTLPCHYSLFHSAPPARHGVNTNHFTPPVRPINGLFEVLTAAGKRCGMVYNWDQLRDLSRPGTLHASHYEYADGSSDERIAAQAIAFLQSGELDFLFCYMDETDEAGHRHGWLEPGYLTAAANADSLVQQVLSVLPSQAPFIVIADHGGHDRTHGIDCPEDKHVPLIIHAPGFEVQWGESTPTLLDIAPTLATLSGVNIPADWEGRSLVTGGI
jgi:predicted AlkP superfamily pyrophosphatase or phosphodiesterase